jgi:hypothetical protein
MEINDGMTQGRGRARKNIIQPLFVCYTHKKDPIQGEYMPEIQQTKEQLLQRRDEILAQLNRAGDNLRTEFELDTDPDEQAIQLEQDEVLIGIEANLQKELAVIEDKLLDLE